MNPSDHALPYASFAELRQAHAELVRSQSASRAPDAERAAQIEPFIARAVATGRLIEDEAGRGNAQGVLDYWAAELLNVSRIDARTWSPPRLAAFEAAVAAGPAPAATTTQASASSSLAIRLGATARLWRESRNDGYLLSGAALAEAAMVAGADADIAALVEASRRHSDQRQRRTRLILLGLVLVLIGGLVLLTVMLLMARSDARAARLARDDVASKTLELEVQTQKTDRAVDAALTNARAVQARQDLLDAALEELRRNVAEGRIGREQIHDAAVWQEVSGSASATQLPQPVLPATAPQADPGAAAKVEQLALGRVEKLGAADPEVRKSSAEDLVKVISDGSVPEQARLKVVDSLAGSLDAAQPANDNGLYNSLVVLNSVPDTEWMRSGWSEARNTLHRNVAQLERKAGAVGPRTQAQLETLKKRLAAVTAGQYRIDLHFTGYDRDRVQAASAALVQQGWRVYSEERLDAAAGKHEVRYGDPADQPAAALLAAALAPQLKRGPLRTLRIAEIQKGRLEIWIGE